VTDVLTVQLARVFAAFPPKDESDGYDPLTQAVYREELRVIPDEYLPLVVRHVLGDWTYLRLPPIGVFKQAFMELALGDTVLSSGEALRWAERQVGRIGGYTPDGKFIEPSYPDPVVRETMRRFGWPRLHRSEADNDWLDKEFARTYAEAREYVGKQVMAGHLTPPPVALPDRGVPALKVVV
jgi:hypothetical protein